MKLIDRLPKSYSELNYKVYFDIINTMYSEQPHWMDDEEWGRYIQFSILSGLLNMPVIDLERLPVSELLPLMNGIEYFNNDVQPSKTSLKIKSMNNLTYDEYVNYQKLRVNQVVNVPEILMIVVEGKTKEEIDSMSVSEVYEAFFMLNKSTQKSLRRLKISLALALVKKNLMLIWVMIKNLFKMNRSYQR